MIGRTRIESIKLSQKTIFFSTIGDSKEHCAFALLPFPFDSTQTFNKFPIPLFIPNCSTLRSKTPTLILY